MKEYKFDNTIKIIVSPYCTPFSCGSIMLCILTNCYVLLQEKILATK
jgi:hypothetical protein